MEYRLAALAGLLVVLASPSLRGQQRPEGPSPEQVRPVLEAYARAGAKAEVRSVRGRTEYHFRLPDAATDADLAKLPTSPFPIGLILSNTKVTPAGLSELKGLDTLDYLQLSDAQLTDKALASLRSVGLLHALEQATTLNGGRPRRPKDVGHLRLGSGVSDAGLSELAELTELQSLVVGQTKVTGAGLGGLKGHRKLSHLSLAGPQVTDEGLAALRRVGLLHALDRATGPAGKRPSSVDEIRELNLSDTGIGDGALEVIKDLRGLTRLELRSTAVTDKGLKRLGRLTNLTTLDAPLPGVEPEVIGALKRLTRLTTLRIGPLTDARLRALREAGLLHALENAQSILHTRPGSPQNVASFDLSGEPVTAAGLKELSGLPNLRLLSLSSFTDQDQVLMSLAEAGLLHTLPDAAGVGWGRPRDAEAVFSLELSMGDLTGEGLKQLLTFKDLSRLSLVLNKDSGSGLVQLRGLERLRRLKLSGAALTPEGLKSLRELKALEDLCLDCENVGLDGVRAIAGLERLMRLELTGLRVGKEGHEFKELQRMRNLKELKLTVTRDVNPSAEELARLKSLVSLRMFPVELSEATVQQLAGLTSLTELDLGPTEVTDDGLKALQSLKKLKSLGFYGGKATPAAIKEFRRAIPKCRMFAEE